mgnify:CR=1 FL=1
MNTKEILQKQNARNTLSKKNKNKLLAVFLSGGLVSCTIGAQVVSAQSIDTFSYENYKNSINAKKIPGLTKKTITFNMAHPTDLVIDNIDLSGLTVSELMVYAKRIDPSKLRITQNSITIPKEEILALKFTPNRLYNTSINFTDGSYASGYIFINIINDPSIPPNTDSDSGSSKPEEDSSGKDDITNKPEQKPDDNDNTDTPNNPDDNKNDTETNPDQGSSDNNKPNGDTENTHIPTINRENIIGTSNKDFKKISTSKPTKVRNDTTGNWKLSKIATTDDILEYAKSYYDNNFTSDDEIHAIVNFTLNTTTCVSTLFDNIISVTIHEYVDKEEHDANKLFSGMVLGDYWIYLDNGDIEKIY